MRQVVARFSVVVLFIIPLVLLSSTATAQQCVGDCDGNGSVSVSELIRCVRIALDQDSVESCPECDPNGDGSVRIPELVTAVSHALCACGICPTPVPTNTPTITRTPTITQTPLPPTATRPPASPTSPPAHCDFNGTWEGQSMTVRDSCDEDFDTEDFDIEIAHGSNGVLTAPAGFQGSVDASNGQCCLGFSFIEPDDEGISCNLGRICQDAGGQSFTGSIEWRFFESADASCTDNDYECEGEESLSASRR